MSKKETIDAFERGLAVIRLFGAAGTPLTISDVANGTGQMRAIARRNLLTLEKLGYVSLRGRHFFPTPRIIELGHGYWNEHPLVTAGSPIIAELAKDTNEAASITMLDGTDVIYLARIQPSRPVRLEVKVGSRFVAHPTSSGRVLLADLHYNRLNAYFGVAPMKAWTEQTITCEQRLRSVLQSVRETGWCCVRGEVEESVAGISVPIRNRAGGVVAALNLGSLIDRATDDVVNAHYLPALRHAAERVQRALPNGL